MFPWVNWCALILTGLWTSGLACDHYSESICGAWSAGDIMIGVLSPFHSMVDTLHKRIHPGRFNCTDFNLISFVRTMAVIHTIDTINDSGFLPGVRLGYTICDTCSDASKAIQSAAYLLATNDTLSIQCDLTEQLLVKAIIGARFSEVSIAVARFLSLYMVPQISTTSSAEPLDNKVRYPSFLRTIPSDKNQTHAVIQLMAHFEWNWVGVVSVDDDYGKAALRSFLKAAENVHVCTAFQEVLPSYLGHSNSDELIRGVANSIMSSTAKVVLLILKEELVKLLFQEMIKRGMSRTWIATDSWSMSRSLASMEGINTIGEIFGFTFITGDNPELARFLTNLTIGAGAVNKFIEEYKDLRFGCSPEWKKHKQCLSSKPAAKCPLQDSLRIKSEDACKILDPQKANDDYLTRAVSLKIVYTERLATWSIAHALRSLLKCNQTVCSRGRTLPPWQLLQELKKTNFTLDEKQFSFDENGNFAHGYDLINWIRKGKERDFKVVGKYNQMTGDVEINPETIYWANNMIPESKCSKSCPPGEVKKISRIACCYTCTKCGEGTYTNDSNLNNCLKCPNETWSLTGWTKCEPRTEDYFKWDASFAICMLVFTGIGYLMLFSILVIFVVSRHGVVFKVAGGQLCFVMIAGLAISFGAVPLFAGRPSDYICKARQTMYGLGFTLCVTCILVKAFRTFLAFLIDRNKQHGLKRFYKPPVIIVCGTAVQGLICLFWLIFDSPRLKKQTSAQSMKILLKCDEGSNWGFGFMLCYIALLAFICFIFALKVRKVPHRFNETGYIIFSMIIYLFVWICFIPIFVADIPKHAAVQACGILVSNFGIICCHFLPKCYMIVFKKKEDISREAYLSRVHDFSINTTDKALGNISVDFGGDSLRTAVPRHSVMTIDSQDSGVITVDSSEFSVTELNEIKNLSDLDQCPQIRQRLRRKSI